MHTYIHTYIHIHTYKHAYITYLHTYTLTHLHTLSHFFIIYSIMFSKEIVFEEMKEFIETGFKFEKINGKNHVEFKKLNLTKYEGYNNKIKKFSFKKSCDPPSRYSN